MKHPKGNWIGDAEKGIAQAQAALKKTTTDAQREVAKKELAKWQANKKDGIKALKERQERLEKAKLDASKLAQANQAAQVVLAKARQRTRRRQGPLGGSEAILVQRQAGHEACRSQGHGGAVEEIDHRGM